MYGVLWFVLELFTDVVTSIAVMWHKGVKGVWLKAGLHSRGLAESSFPITKCVVVVLFLATSFVHP